MNENKRRRLELAEEQALEAQLRNVLSRYEEEELILCHEANTEFPELFELDSGDIPLDTPPKELRTIRFDAYMKTLARKLVNCIFDATGKAVWNGHPIKEMALGAVSVGLGWFVQANRPIGLQAPDQQ